jgi:signal transduction histidine kinase
VAEHPWPPAPALPASPASPASPGGRALGPAALLARWWRRRGLRARVTMTAAAGLLVAFIAADLLLFSVLRVSLTRSVDDSARQGAAEYVALIDARRLPDPVPVPAGSTITIQVLNAAGRIVDVSPDADRLVPLLSPAQAVASARTGRVVLLNGPAFGMPSLLRVAVATASGGYLVIAAVPYSSVGDSLSVVAKGLFFGTPLLFILFTGATWLAVGSTLRPIALLRRGAARITATGVPRDLPVPEARDEVRSLAVTLNDMLSRLSLAQQRQRALVSDTAHELRSPIASIRTQLEVALDHPEGQDWPETARDVHADVLRLARLAEDLLLLARLDEQVPVAGGTTGRGANGQGDAAGRGAGPDGAVARRGAVADLEELCDSVVARYAGTRVSVTAAATGDACLVAADRNALDRLLVNLIDNAVRYAKSQVIVTVRREGEWVVLTVSDDGPGIPAAYRERAFDRFARLDTARSRDGAEDGGAGLGLAIVRATATAYGGTARLEPAVPDAQPPGLRAVVRLPAAIFLT